MIAKHALLSKSCTNIGVAQSIRRRQMLVLARTYFYQILSNKGAKGQGLVPFCGCPGAKLARELRITQFPTRNAYHMGGYQGGGSHLFYPMYHYGFGPFVAGVRLEFGRNTFVRIIYPPGPALQKGVADTFAWGTRIYTCIAYITPRLES